MEESNAGYEQAIIGDVPRYSAIILTGTIVFAAGLAAILAPGDGEFAFWITEGNNWLIAFGFLLLVSGGSSFLNDGLIVSLLSPAIILTGLFLAGVGAGYPSTPTPLERIGASLEAAIYYSAFIGPIGYCLGRAARRMALVYAR